MAKKTSKPEKISSTLAKSDDGTLQITFSIPENVIKHEEEHALTHLAQEVEVPGFRKGKAPLEKARAKISAEKLLEHTLSHILPQAFADAIKEHNLRPIIYPKFEILSQAEIWQIQATTAEINEFDLGDYKKIVRDAISTPTLWTPGQDKDKKELTRDEKEQKALEALLASVKVRVPKMLIEEEITLRLSQLLNRIEKLGLNLESYLASLNKTTDQLRAEYEAQTTASLSLELILNKIAEVEKIAVSKEQVDEAIRATTADPTSQKQAESTDQRRLVESILQRRAVLDSLIGTEVSLGK